MTAIICASRSPFAGGAITSLLEPQRIAAMLLELAREVVQRPN